MQTRHKKTIALPWCEAAVLTTAQNKIIKLKYIYKELRM